MAKYQEKLEHRQRAMYHRICKIIRNRIRSEKIKNKESITISLKEMAP
jgi:hypothetical protein